MAGDAIVLFVNSYQENVEVSPEIVRKLLNTLDHITDEGTLNALVSIFLMIFYWSKKEGKEEIRSLLIADFKAKDAFYKEKFIYVLNRANRYRLDICAAALEEIILKSAEFTGSNYCFFSSNEMTLMLEILLGHSRSVVGSGTRFAVLSLLN